MTSDVALAGLAVAIVLAPPRNLAVWPGIRGLFVVTTPSGDAIPVVLAAVLGFAIVTMLARAATVSALIRTSDHPEAQVPADTRR